MNPIVGIGEVLWDVYPDGHKVAGGAPFNFAFHCHQLGHPAVIVSRVGNDDLGRELRERVRELGLSDEYIQTDYNHPTGTVQVTLDANAVPTYTITENVAWDHIEWDEKLADLASRYRAVCFGTLALRTRPNDRGAIPPFIQANNNVFGPLGPYDPLTLGHWAPRFASMPLRVADLNLRPPHSTEWAIQSCSVWGYWVKMSADELRELGGTEAGLRDQTPRRYYDTCWWENSDPNQVLIVTDGPNGVTVVQGKDEFHEPGVPAKVVDTVGAGDAFTAAMVCLHLEGKPLRACARFAVHYAARVCEQPGGTPRIDRSAVERAVFGK
ncbi:carbohydrate kinase family protein [Frigoriglobus tundricola]|uniref:Fructokinase n=1 Tax=Frigoriglobus tundricola TaxID=2774151 RepID=A0A6M5YNN7_9BACT|nr:carbohydrate kinase [Frigoriglobus tundricola]QJW95709.1 Fructokinase [Frigoriglobus tundricola]